MADKAGEGAPASVPAAGGQRLKLQTSYGQAVMWSKGFGAAETKAAFSRARELATGKAGARLFPISRRSSDAAPPPSSSPATRRGASPRTSPNCRNCRTTGPRLGGPWARLVQRPQSPATRRPHRVESRIGFGVAGIDLDGIPTVNDLSVLYEYGVRARMSVILETNTSHPGPAFQRVYPTKGRYCECVVGCAIFEDAIEVIGDDFVVARIRSGRRHVLWHGNVAE